MIATEHTQSLDQFGRTAAATVERVAQTGVAEVITVDGRPRAVLVSADAYDAMAREAQLSRDVAMMRQSMAEIAAGQGLDARQVFDELRQELLAMKAAQQAGDGGQRSGGGWSSHRRCGL
jgi:prevent-host-death family protein